MFKLILSRIKNRKKAAFSFLIALIVLFSVIPIGIAASLKTKSVVTSTIEQYARGSYDLLIRPKGEKTYIERTLGVVEENYIDGGNGGISIEDWQKISEDSDIEVAAPVASLGYFSGNQTVVQLPLLPYPARFTWQYATSDGLNEYLIDEEKSFVYFEGKEQQYVDYYAPPETLLGINGARMPRSYYQLIAIDPANEQALTGINYSDLYREIEEDSDEDKILKGLLSYRDNPPVIPILQNRDFSVSLKMKLTVERLKIETAVYKEKYNIQAEDPFYFPDSEIEEEFVAELSNEPVQSVEIYEIDLSEVQSPFNGQYVQLTDDFVVTIAENGPLSNDSGKYFSASKVPYKIVDDPILVEELEDSTPPVYRTVQEKGDSYLMEQSAPFMLWQMGSFSLQKKENQLASSPLGIYGGSPIVTEDGVTLTPTIKPGSFINTGAAGLTTIEAAKIIKGAAPIDAIRIRVAGITEYNEEAKGKVEKLATKYLEQGYVVDIVAGASDKEHNMDVENIGKVTAPWTTLGVASIITEGINSLTFVSIGLFIVFSLLWIGSRLMFEYFGTLDEKKILRSIGWNEKQIQKLYIYEPCLYVLCSGLVVLVLFILFNVTSIFYFIFTCLLAITLAFILITYRLLPKFFSENKEKRKSGAVYYYAKFIIPTALILVISLIFISVQTAAILNYVQEINSSKLGAFTASLTLPMQLILLAVTIGLTCISVNNAINLMINERKKEFQMYALIGWTKKMIVKHFGKEVLQWTLVPILFAMLISCCILLMFKFSVWLVISLCILFAAFMQVGILILVKSRNYLLN
jgi:putative ABC transport system permease protein